MKVTKGQAGYIDGQKKRRALYTLLLFGICAAVFFTGYATTHTRNNVLTIVSVLGCLPAAKAAAGLIVILPYRTIEEEKVRLLKEKAPLVTTAYDMIITSREKVMPVEAMAISAHLICGYTGREKADTAYIERYIRTVLKENHYDRVTVKIFRDYGTFLGRAEGMNNIEAVEKHTSRRTEESIRDIMLNLSM